jgi:hypothetical protein
MEDRTMRGSRFKEEQIIAILREHVTGDLAGILALTSGSKRPVSMGDGPLQLTLVAGVGFEPTTFRL